MNATTPTLLCRGRHFGRLPGIEPGRPAPQTGVLPLNYSRHVVRIVIAVFRQIVEMLKKKGSYFVLVPIKIIVGSFGSYATNDALRLLSSGVTAHVTPPLTER